MRTLQTVVVGYYGKKERKIYVEGHSEGVSVAVGDGTITYYLQWRPQLVQEILSFIYCLDEKWSIYYWKAFATKAESAVECLPRPQKLVFSWRSPSGPRFYEAHTPNMLVYGSIAED